MLGGLRHPRLPLSLHAESTQSTPSSSDLLQPEWGWFVHSPSHTTFMPVPALNSAMPKLPKSSSCPPIHILPSSPSPPHQHLFCEAHPSEASGALSSACAYTQPYTSALLYLLHFSKLWIYRWKGYTLTIDKLKVKNRWPNKGRVIHIAWISPRGKNYKLDKIWKQLKSIIKYPKAGRNGKDSTLEWKEPPIFKGLFPEGTSQSK